MFWDDTKLPWINPSPNLPTWESSLTFCGTVLFEGTNISEGRGTTRSLEVIGHPKIEPFSLLEEMTPRLKKLEDYNSFKLRPIVFMPTFQNTVIHPAVAFIFTLKIRENSNHGDCRNFYARNFIILLEHLLSGLKRLMNMNMRNCRLIL